jgi:hypothetical protein
MDLAAEHRPEVANGRLEYLLIGVLAFEIGLRSSAGTGTSTDGTSAVGQATPLSQKRALEAPVALSIAIL